MNLNVPVELHNDFKATTAAQGQNMTNPDGATTVFVTSKSTSFGRDDVPVEYTTDEDGIQKARWDICDDRNSRDCPERFRYPVHQIPVREIDVAHDPLSPGQWSRSLRNSQSRAPRKPSCRSLWHADG